MSDFCRQCSLEIFGEDFENFKGLTTTTIPVESVLWEVLCEGCGKTLVNNKGECINPYCLKKHREQNE